MIKIENTDVYGFEAAIRGMRNPRNSWDNSDSFLCDGKCRHGRCHQFGWIDEFGCSTEGDYIIGKNDLALMKKLAAAGTDHRKFMRMINVTMDITAPLYWWKEFDTYKVGTVRDSCSTMHKIAAKEFTLSDFSREHLCTSDVQYYQVNDTEEDEAIDLSTSALEILGVTIQALNAYRKLYLKTNDKKFWRQMIQLLPSSYNQRATIQLNYEVLANMYKSRKEHKLDEWRDFCRWIESLPYSELITGGNADEMQP